jgi:hypothetical protein
MKNDYMGATCSQHKECIITHIHRFSPRNLKDIDVHILEFNIKRFLKKKGGGVVK